MFLLWETKHSPKYSIAYQDDVLVVTGPFHASSEGSRSREILLDGSAAMRIGCNCYSWRKLSRSSVPPLVLPFDFSITPLSSIHRHVVRSCDYRL
jgi:hypothetical protein